MAEHPDDLPEEVLMAYADGELTEGDRRRVEDILSRAPEQRERLAPYLITRDALAHLIGGAVPPIVPDRLVDAINRAPIGVRDEPFASKAPGVVVRLRRALLPHASAPLANLALAASILATAGLGYVAATLVTSSHRVHVPTTTLAVGAQATSTLAQALDTAPSAQIVEHADERVRVLLTFKDKAGRYCRQYEMVQPGEGASAGYACRQGDGAWRIGFHTPIEGGDLGGAATNGKFSPAGDALDAGLEKAIDAHIFGPVVEGDEEARLIARGWAAP